MIFYSNCFYNKFKLENDAQIIMYLSLIIKSIKFSNSGQYVNIVKIRNIFKVKHEYIQYT